MLISATSLLPDKLLLRVRLLSLKESLHHIPLSWIVARSGYYQNCKSKQPGEEVENQTMGRHHVKHKFINIKKKLSCIYPQLSLSQFEA